MKAVMISIQPKWVEKIASGQKTIEVRKTAPEVPFKAYIYCTNAKPYLYREANPPFELFLDSDIYESEGYDDRLFSGKVIGEFICDEIIEWQYDKGHQYYVDYPDDCTSYFPYLKCHSEATGLRCSEIENYGKGKPLYGWHISDLKIYDKPKALREFSPICSYKNDDGSCQYRKVDCLYQQCDYNTDGSVNLITCGKSITHAPQSWQYVEEI